ncbi:MAG: hypothetical protein SNJ65_15520, partial [Roseiflexus sp.]
MRRIVLLHLCVAMALAAFPTACDPSEPVVKPSYSAVAGSPGETLSPVLITPTLPAASITPTTVTPRPAPASDGAPMRDIPLVYDLRQKENEVVIVALDLASGEERSVATIPLTTSAGMSIYGTVLPAPDQKTLAVSIDNLEVQQVYLIKNNKARLILSAEGEHSIDEWSPDGARFLLFSTKDNDQGCMQQTCFFDIYSIDAATGVETRLTTTTDPEVDAVWSPDGKQIAFLRGCVDISIDECGPDLYLMNADGSDERLLAEGWIASPHFLSPDQIVYAQHAGERASIYRIATNGGTPQSVVEADTDILGMRVTPDGQTIAFINQRGECPFEPCVREIYVVA